MGRTVFHGTAEDLAGVLKPFVAQKAAWIVYRSRGTPGKKQKTAASRPPEIATWVVEGGPGAQRELSFSEAENGGCSNPSHALHLIKKLRMAPAVTAAPSVRSSLNVGQIPRLRNTGTYCPCMPDQGTVRSSPRR